ncbi:hypothetical protein Tco_0645396 [Tanacetum coccineum]
MYNGETLRSFDIELLPVDASPINLSPDYISDSDPEEDDEEDPEEDPADYPAGTGYLRKGQKQSLKRQNRPREQKEREEKVKIKAKVKKSTKVNSEKVKVKDEAVNKELLNGPTHTHKSGQPIKIIREDL